MQSENLMETGSFWFPEAANAAAASVDGLYSFILWGSTITFIGILLALYIFIKRYRRRSEAQLAVSQMEHNNALEISWTVIPFILVMIVFYWGYKDFIAMSIAPVDAMEIRVTGKKWLWQFDYPKDGVSTLSELVVPVNRPVKLIMSSEDILHSFYLPNFRIKRDVVPNRYTRLTFTANRTGIFQVFCTEYCGDGHSNMLATLRVVSEEDYAKWLKEGQSTDDIPLLELGQQLYTKYACNTCHSLDGSSAVGPTWKGVYGTKRSFTDGTSGVIDDNYIRESIVNPQAKIAAGYAPVMPAFAGLLSDREIDAIIEAIKAVK